MIAMSTPLVVGAVKPWNSRFAEAPKERIDEPNTYDDQESIDRCTKCTLPVCVNCLDKRLAKKRGEHYRDIVNALQAGKNPKSISAMYGVNIRTVRNIKRTLESGGEN